MRVTHLALILLLFAVLMATSGCAHQASNCAGWAPISTAGGDKLTRLTKAQIVEHNRQGVKQGCWR